MNHSLPVVPIKKYNPGFLSDQALIDSFCVRQVEFESLIRTLRDTEGNSNVHRIVIGPRGSGKTTLLLRVVAEVRRDPQLSSKFYPIALPEEHYEVSTSGEFWLECLEQLAAHAPPHKNASRLAQIYETIRREENDRDLEDRCLAALIDFANSERKRLLITAENLNMMFEEIEDVDAGWRLRKVLQTEPMIMLFASATSHFREIDCPDHAMYNSIDTLTLRRLNTRECNDLWTRVSGCNTDERQIRSVEILTGGNPRIVAIMARFGRRLSLRTLMDEILNLVDEHTDYFKNHLEALPHQERRVYLALALLWKPATTKEIADRARLSITLCTDHIYRLINCGAVLQADGAAYPQRYYLAERMYNIYYLVRKRGHPSEVIKALIQFMAAYYSERQLVTAGIQFAQEALGAEPGDMEFAIEAVARLFEVLPASQSDLLNQLPDSFIVEAGKDRLLKHTGASPGSADLVQEMRQLYSISDYEGALKISEQIVSQFDSSEVPSDAESIGQALLAKGSILATNGRTEEALGAFSDAANRASLDREQRDTRLLWATSLLNKGLVLANWGQAEDSIRAFNEVIERFGGCEAPSILVNVSRSLFNKGKALSELEKDFDALRTYTEAVELIKRCDDPSVAEEAFKASVNKAGIQVRLDLLEESLRTYDEALGLLASQPAISRYEYRGRVFLNRAESLRRLKRAGDALDACNAALSLAHENASDSMATELRARTLFEKAAIIEDLERHEESLAAYDEIATQFIESEEPEVIAIAVSAVINKSVLLAELDRIHEALHAYASLEQHQPANLSEEIADLIEKAELNAAALRIRLHEYGAAAAIATTVLRGRIARKSANSVRARWIRAEARFAEGETAGCEADIAAALGELTGSNARLQPVINQLVLFAARLGSGRVLTLIRRSPAADLLGPLAAALDLDLGRDPGVALEVFEVASDIQNDLQSARDRTEGAVRIAAHAARPRVSG